MKKVLIIGCVLLLCCCLFSFVGFGLIGYLENNGSCIYKGALSSVSSGACAQDQNKANTNDSAVNNNTNNNQNQNQNTDQVTTQTFNGEGYTFTYPSNFKAERAADTGRVSVYAANGLDNLGISASNSSIYVSQSNCEDLAEATMDELYSYDARTSYVSVINFGDAYACLVDFTADYGTAAGRVAQTQYYVESTNGTYILTITINQDDSNFDVLDQIARSFRLK